MSIRTLNYFLNTNKISPAAEQFAGTQGDIKATELCFTLSDELWSSLPELSALRFRFDGYDGEGNVLRGDSFSLSEKEPIAYTLPEALTRYGGRICVYLIITQMQNDETEMELYSFPARMRLNALPTASGETGGERESFTTLTESAKTAAQTAIEAKKTAVEAMERTELAHTALTEGTEFIFDGGTASDTVTVDLVVDSSLSEASENPVQNKVISEKLSELEIGDATFDEQLKILTEAVNKKAEQSDLDTVNERLNGEADYIAEQGTSGIWTYRKWNSGIAECWGSQVVSVSGWKVSVNLYIANEEAPEINYPFSFVEAPMLTVTAYNYTWIRATSSVTRTTTIPKYELVRESENNETNPQVSVMYRAIGKWK